jgi:2-polyprenyl-6-methoxyphenol hydroxylase-like FAD-dependent oxidoreductase
MKLKKVLIVGAGVGGLTLAIALQRLGFEVEIYEKASKLQPIGWGLALAPNALLALRQIDLDKSVIQAGHKVCQVQMKTWQGKILKEVPLSALEEKLGNSVVTINRGRLHQILLAAIDESKLHIGNKATSYKEYDTQVILTLENGQEVEGDLLVGADGIHSMVRRQLFPNSQLHYSGYTAWRGICESKNLLKDGTYLSILGRGIRFGCTHNGDGTLCWYATYLTSPGKTIVDSPQALVLKRYHDWCFPVCEIIASTHNSSIIQTDVYDADPLVTWSSQHVTLLGDAAHPMTPDMNQGAASAIEDAIILANSLQFSSTLHEGIQLYESYRIKRTSNIIKRSRQSGQVEHIHNPLLYSLRNAVYAYTPVEILLKQLIVVSKFESPAIRK